MNWFKTFWQALTKRPAAGGIAVDATVDLTPRARQVLILAQKEAERSHQHFTGTEHVLLGLITLGQGVAFNVLTGAGFDLEKIRAVVEKEIGLGPAPVPTTPPSLTPRVKKVLSLARKEASLLNHAYVGTEHLLLGLLREQDNVAALILKGQGMSLAQMRQQILKEVDPSFSADENENTGEV
jgi:ATP-dependent Clp protease ATP-binding subunit ClpC